MSNGRLHARPSRRPPFHPDADTRTAGAPGLHRLEHGALLYVPPGTPPRRLVVLLHGAGGDAARAVALLQDDAGEHGLLLLAPQSVGATWDVILGGYGVDVTHLDAALTDVFARHDVDPAGLAIGGFSDGASYALSLGLANGDLLPAVLAFSPGFAAPGSLHGHPRVYISHGRADRVLPVERCGRRLARELAAAGYPVAYEEFDGGHVVPPQVRSAAVRWLVEEDA